MSRVIHILSSPYWGGREGYALDVCRALDRAGRDVVVYTRDVEAVDTPFREAGLRVRHLPLSGFSDITSALRLSAEFRRSPLTTVIHTHTTRDAFIALLARKLARRRDLRVVLTVHRAARGRDSWIHRRVLRNLHALIFVSRLARDYYTSAWHPGRLPLPPERCHTLHGSLYLPEAPSLTLPQKGPVVITYIGPVVPGKGVATLIESLPALKGLKARLCIAGPGDPDYIDSLKRLAVRLDVMAMVDWCGTSLSTRQVMERTCIGVVPSMVPEAFGTSSALFMAWGRPQVVTNGGAQAEYMRPDRDALFVPPSNPEALSTALRILITDAALRARIGAEAATRYADRLAWPHHLHHLLSIYNT